jgi:hypothetical protein
MKQRLNKHYGSYGQRSQAECGFSMFKRRLGATVNGRTYQSQCRDLLLMTITYNIMALRVLWWVTSGLGRQRTPVISGENALLLGEKTCHASAMATFKFLHDLYRFPGFVPVPRVRGLFGDSHAVVITLRRRRKKRAAVSVARNITAITTSGPDGSAICPVATSACISRFSNVGSIAHSVGA